MPNYSCAVSVRSLWLKRGHKGGGIQEKSCYLASPWDYTLLDIVSCLQQSFLRPFFNFLPLVLLLPFWWCGICMALHVPYFLLTCIGIGAQSCFSSSWPFSVIQATAIKGSEILTVGSDHPLLYTSQQLKIQHLHTLLLRLAFLIFFHTFCFDAFCFPNCYFKPHLLKLFVTQLPLPVTLVWIHSISTGVIVRCEISVHSIN